MPIIWSRSFHRLLNAPSPDPPLQLDTDLRPEGKQGPPVRTVASYLAYYDRWRSFWEAQALLRADRVAGDPEVWNRVRAGIKQAATAKA